MDFLKLVGEVGFPIAGAIAAGYFVFLTVKFILAGVRWCEWPQGDHSGTGQPSSDNEQRSS